MRTISVKEAAAALNLTPRAVSYRLEKGQLKGTLAKNDVTGVPEWRIYPNKEILAGLNKATVVEDASTLDFEPQDVVDAEAVTEAANDEISQQTNPSPSASNFQILAEQFVRPLVEEVKAQTLALAEKDRIIEEQGRQLRLLPDLRRRAEEEQARAEEERKAAELKELELLALKKQASALAETESRRLQERENELGAVLIEERLKTEALEAKIERIEQAKVTLEMTLQQEIERLKEEKATQEKLVHDQLQNLSEKLEKLDKPWWKKLFSAPEHQA